MLGSPLGEGRFYIFGMAGDEDTQLPTIESLYQSMVRLVQSMDRPNRAPHVIGQSIGVGGTVKREAFGWQTIKA